MACSHYSTARRDQKNLRESEGSGKFGSRGADSPASEPKITLYNRFENPDEDLLKFNELDQHLIDSIDKYLYNSRNNSNSQGGMVDSALGEENEDLRDLKIVEIPRTSACSPGTDSQGGDVVHINGEAVAWKDEDDDVVKKKVRPRLSTEDAFEASEFASSFQPQPEVLVDRSHGHGEGSESPLKHKKVGTTDGTSRSPPKHESRLDLFSPKGRASPSYHFKTPPDQFIDGVELIDLSFEEDISHEDVFVTPSRTHGLRGGSPNGSRDLNSNDSYHSDSDSSEEDDNDECIICSESMRSELKNEIGVLDECSHIFCFKCIKMWSERANICPLCKREFGYIRKVNLYYIQDLVEKNRASPYFKNGTPNYALPKDGDVITIRDRKLRCIRKNKISKLKKAIREKRDWFNLIPSVPVKVERKKLSADEEEDEGCTICGVDDNWPQLLLCDNCDKGYHIYCLNPPLTSIPESNWYCSNCSHLHPISIASTSRSETSGTGRTGTGTVPGADPGSRSTVNVSSPPTRTRDSINIANILRNTNRQEINHEMEIRLDLLSQVYRGLNTSSPRSESLPSALRNKTRSKGKKASSKRDKRKSSATGASRDLRKKKVEKRLRKVRKAEKRDEDRLDFCVNNKDIDRIIQDSMESIDNYMVSSAARTSSSNTINRHKVLDGLTTNDIDRLLSEPSTSSTDKKYTSFVYRYKTVVGNREEYGNSTSFSRNKPEPHINGSTVKYLF